MKSSSNRFEPGDVLYSRLRPYLNKVIAPDFSGLCSGEFIVLTPGNEITAEFLRARLISQEFVEFAGSLDAGDRPRVKWKQISAFEFALPPLGEQSRLVSDIERLFQRIDEGAQSLERALAASERLDAALQLDALARAPSLPHGEAEPLTERLASEREDRWERRRDAGLTRGAYKPPVPPVQPLTVPKGWAVCSLDAVCELITDGDHNPPKRTATGVPHLTAKHVVGGVLNFEDTTFISEADFEKVAQRFEPAADDVIVTCVGTIGRVAVVPEGVRFSPDRNLAGLRPLPSVRAAYLAAVLASPHHQMMMRGASGSTAQPHLYLGDLRSLPVPVAPVEVQDEVVAKLRTALSGTSDGCANLKAALANGGLLRVAIVRDALSGGVSAFSGDGASSRTSSPTTAVREVRSGRS